MTTEARSPNDQGNPRLFGIRPSDFGFLSDFGIRPSDFFNLRHSFHFRQPFLDLSGFEHVKRFRIFAHGTGIESFFWVSSYDDEDAQRHRELTELADEI